MSGKGPYDRESLQTANASLNKRLEESKVLLNSVRWLKSDHLRSNFPALIEAIDRFCVTPAKTKPCSTCSGIDDNKCPEECLIPCPTCNGTRAVPTGEGDEPEDDE